MVQSATSKPGLSSHLSDVFAAPTILPTLEMDLVPAECKCLSAETVLSNIQLSKEKQ